ncbi:MAG: prepilin-type N-terminal cleavage/methylation domain-containing protein [Colwellia sp.]|nr:prepilin-type N-terminal cleavage/methylation domain-containing protein [Colwellia sp.]
MKILHKNKIISESGFTMIELIVVIIILAIMATTVIPKFFNSNGFEEYTYQAEVIAKLRTIQIRAMQQTDVTECHTVLVTETALGIPINCDLDLADGWQGEIVNEPSAPNEPGTTNVEIQTGHEVTFPTPSGNYSFTFDSMGKPDCIECLITINGDTDLFVAIESEGYIHEGPLDDG